MVKLASENNLRAVGHKGGRIAEDKIVFQYQTHKWGKPARFQLREIARNGDRVTLEAQLRDVNGILCLDARNPIRFALAGDGELIDSLGVNTAAPLVELCNGRAMISVLLKGGKPEVSVSCKYAPTEFLRLESVTTREALVEINCFWPPYRQRLPPGGYRVWSG